MAVSIPRDKWSRCLNRKRTLLVNRLQFDGDLLNDCLGSDLLVDQQIASIKAKETPYKQADAFCDHLLRIDSSKYFQLLLLLNKHQADLAREMAEFLGVSEELAREAEKLSNNDQGELASRAENLSNSDQRVQAERPATVNTGDGSAIHVSLQKPDKELLLNMLMNPKKFYRMSAIPRGRAIILNNETFEDGRRFSKRNGSYYDVANLSDLFTGLEFQIDIWSNCTAQQIKAKVEDERREQFHSRVDAFVFISMSHGGLGVIYGTDGIKVHIERDIIDKFDGENCSQLIGKPKLFFIQSCRGDEATVGSDAASDSVQDEGSDSTVTDGPPVIPSRIHEKADVLAFYATVPGYVSYRNKHVGSWFVRDLIVSINEHAHDQDIGHIATQVNNKMNERKSDGSGQCQTSKLEHTLTKFLYLLPKYADS